ncbi:MAG: PAS domain S-box protein [Chloroflexota bacterium]|nr:PAS domain S-box protein [Chloroflexota bacterium]
MNGILRILILGDTSEWRTLGMPELDWEIPDFQVQQITEAKGFAQALEGGNFDLVIADCRLQWADGMEVIRMVVSRWPECPVIMLADTSTEEIAAEAIQAGLVDDYVIKSPEHFARLPVVALLTLQRARQRQSLKEANARYRSLFDGVPVALYRTTPDGKALDANLTLVQMLGYPNRESLLAVSASDVYVNPEDRQRWQALMDREGVVRDFEMQLRQCDGTVIWVRDSAHTVCDSDGQVLYYEGFMEDITARRRVEEKERQYIHDLARLSKSAMEFVDLPPEEDIYWFIGNCLKEIVGDAIVIVSSFDVASDTFCVRAVSGIEGRIEVLIEILGSDLVGRSFVVGGKVKPAPTAGRLVEIPWDLYEFSSRRVPKGVCQVLERVFNLGDIYVMGFFRKGELFGSAVIMMHRGAELKNPGIVETFINQASVALQRKQAEESLRRERDFSQNIIETTPALVVMLDAGGRITMLNRACEELTGYTAAEAIGQEISKFLIPARFVQDEHKVFSSLQAGVPPGNYEIPLLTRDGNERWITWTYADVKDEAGNVTSIVGIGVDVTDFRRVQQALERRNRELQALVEAGQLLSGTLNLDQVLDRLLDVVQKQFNMASVSFSSYDPDRQMFEIRAQRYDAPEHQVGRIGDRRTRDQHPYSSRALDTGQPVYEPDLWNAPHISEEKQAEARGKNIRSVVEVPLIAKSQPVGVLHLRSFETPRFFTEEELAFARAIAPGAAAAIDNARLYRRLEQRIQEISTLYHAGQVLTGVIDMERLLHFVIEAAVGVLPSAEKGTIQLYDRESDMLVARAGIGYSEQELAQMRFLPDASVAGQCFTTAKPWVVDDTTDDPYFQHVGPPVVGRIRSMVAVPLVSKGRSIGVFCVDNLSTTSAFAADAVRVLSTLAAQAAAAIEAARLFTEVDAARARAEGLAARVVQAQEDERRRIARELHDEVGQLLTGAKLSQEMLVADLPAELAELRERALENVDLIDETMDVVRKLSLDLRPAALDELGLPAALEWHIERYQHQTGLRVTLHQGLLPTLPDSLATAVYRIIQEALTNVARHASAKSVMVEVEHTSPSLCVRVTDDGCGFDVAAVLRAGSAEERFGLMGLEERATLLGGKVNIESAPGQGTRIAVELPLPERE